MWPMDYIESLPVLQAMRQYLCLADDTEEDLAAEEYQQVFEAADVSSSASDSSDSSSSEKKKKSKKKNKKEKSKKKKKGASKKKAAAKPKAKGKAKAQKETTQEANVNCMHFVVCIFLITFQDTAREIEETLDDETEPNKKEALQKAKQAMLR